MINIGTEGVRMHFKCELHAQQKVRVAFITGCELVFLFLFSVRSIPSTLKLEIQFPEQEHAHDTMSTAVK